MLIPYEKGVAEKLKRIASKYGFTTVFKTAKDPKKKIISKTKG